MYEYIPKKNSKKAMALVCLFLIGGVLLFFMGGQLKGVMGYVWIFQLIGLALFAASIFIFSRYLTKSYIYAVTNDGDLTVTEVQGKRRVTVCRLSISQISHASLFDGSDTAGIGAEKAKIKAEKRKVYNYCIELAPDKVCYIFSEEYEDIAVILQPDEKLFEYLKKEE